MSTYLVQKGDSLSTIAEKQLGHASQWPQIAALNNIAAPYTIYVGQHLALPDANTPAPSSSTTPAPSSSTAPAPGPQPAGSSVFTRIVTWAKANPGKATFYGLSIALSAAGVWFMWDQAQGSRGKRKHKRR